MRHVATQVGCIKNKDKRHFDIYVTKTFIDSFGKRYNENKLWDSVLQSDVDKQMETARKWNKEFSEAI